MSFGLVSGDDSGFRWFGDRIAQFVGRKIDEQLYRAGERIVARAQQLAPVRSGVLRNSISYVVGESQGITGHYLSIQVAVPYGIYQEFGTRHIKPHPYIRPALNELSRIMGAEVQMVFAGAAGHTGLLAGIGRQGAGFAMHHASRKPLTPRQIQHVEKHLIPSIKRLNRGNTRRARMIVRPS